MLQRAGIGHDVLQKALKFWISQIDAPAAGGAILLLLLLLLLLRGLLLRHAKLTSHAIHGLGLLLLLVGGR